MNIEAFFDRRHYRERKVFHIMDHSPDGVSDLELWRWRDICADYINGDRNDFPVTVEEFRKEWNE